ncbi:MAG: glycosyltransferase family 4 protein [Methylococcales symbiont of Iophon sp. n. MRB-2018]|nr:MAG: glycosyltransferase family 4 protein [Methylococcales symbiont of Iophon sp. n. MRB-2018]KAF3980753.1 MAG: glycosyltransferase family 4 protein [Methylococcales symbiont of Iophon sp. n. MRB-2018]
MKLAFCLYKFFPFGGLQRDFLRISRICHNRGHSIDVYTMSWEGLRPEDYNIHIIAIKHWTNHGRNKYFLKALSLIFNSKHYDAVIGFNKMPFLDLYYAADPCYVAKTKPALLKLSGRYRHFAKFERAVFGKESSTQVMMISDIEKQKFIEHYNTQPERLYSLPPGISPDRKAPDNAAEIRQQWRKEFNIAEDDKVVLMIGSAFKGKGLDRTLKGIAALPKTLLEKTQIMVLGKDNPEPFYKLASKLGLRDRLTIFLGRDDVPRFLLGADLFVHPAYNENTGTVILEAIVAGLPVIVSEACGYAFHVKQAQAGCITPLPFQQKEFNQQLEFMLSSDKHETWVKNCIAYSLAEDLYSMPEVAADLIESVAEKLIAQKNP